MKQDLVEVLSIFDKNKTVSEILTTLEKEVEITRTTKQISNKDPELVDLGLPSGNLWMTHNMGANSESDYGYYYQLGSLVGYQGNEAKSHSSWETCPFNNGKNEFDEEYFLENKHKWFDKDDNLKPEYDVVTQTYGSDYRMPTDKDFQELLDNTTKKFVRHHKGTGIAGRLFTSKINGKTLFIPFSGYVCCGSFYGIGYWYSLWSSRLYSSHLRWSYSLHCNSNNAGLIGYRHYFGFTLRGIKVKGN